MSSYAEFLARKAQVNKGDGFEPVWIPDWLFPFQRELVDWSLRMGRAALLADCGLGKGPMALVWAENVRRRTGQPVLLIAPLAVSVQLQREAEKFGLEAAVSRDGSIPADITITNYERLEQFDPANFAGAVCDESSAIKHQDSARRMLVTQFMRKMRYRLLATATAAPNDYTELGPASEALGYLGHVDMLNRFFTNDQKPSKANRNWSGAEWRFKGHAEEPFWRWVTSWARACRRPSDLGFQDNGFDLPPLQHHEYVVKAERAPDDRLFEVEARGLREEREQIRRTLVERCELAGERLANGKGPAIGWVHLNDESALLAKLTDGVEIGGSESPDQKEEKLVAFAKGEINILVTKPSIAGHGMNFQHAHRMTYFPSWSYEQYYQAVRRMWRFGQQSPVIVDVVSTEGGKNVMRGLKRKADQAERMFEALVHHMRQAQSADHRNDSHAKEMEVPEWVVA